MKTLVIHPPDPTTDFLKEIYKDKDWTVTDASIPKSKLFLLIKSHDRIVMLGHGTDDGLIGFSPHRYVINSRLVYLLREKYCVCIWCNADVFVTDYKLKGFFTGMIISEYEEAMIYAVNTTDSKISASNAAFANAIKMAIDAPNMLEVAKENYINESCLVTRFNRANLYHTSDGEI